MVDSFRHQGLRQQLVEKLAEKGIKNAQVLEAINKIPRHLFMDNAFVSFSYQASENFNFGRSKLISRESFYN